MACERAYKKKLKLEGILFLILSILSFISSFSQGLPAGLRTANIFGDNMVLQRGTKTQVWGWSDTGSLVLLTIDSKTVSCYSDEHGKWIVNLPNLTPGGPYVLNIVSGKDTVNLTNILVGDVWLASGQSNMQWKIGWGINSMEETINNVNNNNVRFFTVPDDLNNKPQEDIKEAQWMLCNPANAADFSATAWFFANKLQLEIDIPVGIVVSAWGGTRIESWVSTDAFKVNTSFADSVKNLINSTRDFELGYEDFMKTNLVRDSILNISNNGVRSKVFMPDYNDSSWKTMDLPGKWRANGVTNFYGYCWFRKEIDIPAGNQNKELIIRLGDICCENICFFNGYKIKQTKPSPETEYIVPGKYVKAGKNFISLRVLGRWNNGSFNSDANQMFALSKGNLTKIPLMGTWKYNELIEIPTPEWIEYYNYPTFIYNAKIAPLIPFSLKGIIWYQGESNVSDQCHYNELFKLLINDWRIQWKQDYLPFIFAQLSNYGEVSTSVKSNIALVRVAQAEALSLPYTAMTVNIDLGENGDVHFGNKQECGRRFALSALDIAYGFNNIADYPKVLKATLVNNRVFLLINESVNFPVNDSIKAFTISANGRDFLPATAIVNNDTIIIWNDSVAYPTAIRYGWSDNPVCVIRNCEGLPLPPFKIEKIQQY